MKYNKTHPYTILEYLSKFSFLFIIPVLQQLIIRPRSLLEIINTMGINILILFLIVAFSIKEYSAINYHSSKHCLYLSYGVIFKKRSTIPYKNIHSITVTQSIIPAIFGSIRLTLDTPSKKTTKADISINLSNKNLNNTLKTINPKTSYKTVYTSSTPKIILMSASWSNSAAGLLFLAPFINKLGTLIGEEATERLYSTVDISLQLVAFGVPPIAATLAYILLAGWVISLLLQISRYTGFTVLKFKDNILIKRGLINTYSRILKITDISAISVKQSLLMKILKLESAYINAVGNSKEKGDKNMLIACASKKALKQSLYNTIPESLFVDLTKQSLFSIFPKTASIKSFLFVPVSIFIFSLVISIIFYTNSNYKQFIILFLIFIIPVLIWWILFRVSAYRHSKACLYPKQLLINGFRRLSLISGNIPLNKIQSIQITQNPLQKKVKRANLKIYVFSERKDYFLVKHLDLANVENFVEKVNNLYN